MWRQYDDVYRFYMQQMWKKTQTQTVPNFSWIPKCTKKFSVSLEGIQLKTTVEKGFVVKTEVVTALTRVVLNDRPIFRCFMTAEPAYLIHLMDIILWVLNRHQGYSRTSWEVWKYYDGCEGIKSISFSQRASRFDPALDTQSLTQSRRVVV